MRGIHRKRSTLWTTAALCALSAGLLAAPARIEGPLRSAVVDAVISGQSLVRDCYPRWRLVPQEVSSSDAPAPSNTAKAVEAAAARTRALELECRRLRIENARLQNELTLAEKYGVSPMPVRNTRPTDDAARPAAVRAELVGPETVAFLRSARYLNQGRAHGVTEAAFVLDGGPVIDQGSERGIRPELDVFIGRCVVGRIASVGRWTSTLELVTDSRYRALAQIVRPSDQGGSFGAEGILIGQGTSWCKLNEVPTTQTVRVGDEVYSSDRDGRTSVPLYYGRIVRVEEAGRHWDISVEPAVKAAELKSVAVLTLPLILRRTLAANQETGSTKQ